MQSETKLLLECRKEMYPTKKTEWEGKLKTITREVVLHWKKQRKQETIRETVMQKRQRIRYRRTNTEHRNFKLQQIIDHTNDNRNPRIFIKQEEDN